MPSTVIWEAPGPWIATASMICSGSLVRLMSPLSPERKRIVSAPLLVFASMIAWRRVQSVFVGVRQSLAPVVSSSEPTVKVWGGRPLDDEDAVISFFGALFRSLSGRWNRLSGYFLLAVSRDKVHALNYGGFDKLVITGEI